MALLVFANLPIIARLYSQTQLDPPTGEIYLKLKQIWQSVINKFSDLNAAFTENEQHCSYHILPILTSIVLIIIALNGGKVFGYSLIKADFPVNSKPSATLNIIKELKTRS